ncbi:MAG: AI-2E family transporter, partial [Bacteroidales bacterium]|nr:AI-2E family transporter [Bacteroidales bacterium]
MENLKWTEKLARFILYAIVAVIVCAVVWYFRKVVIFILVAGVLSLIGKPLCDAVKRLHIKNHYIPDWLASICTLVVIFGVFAAVITLIVPIVNTLVRQISTMNVAESVKSLAVPLSELNQFLRNTFPNLGGDFRIEMVVMEELQKLLSVSAFTSVIGSVTSFIVGTGVALFAIIFISFFFFKDQTQFNKIVAALVPDRSEKEAINAMGDIQVLLTRYFLGLILEVIGVTVVNWLGLFFIARLGFNVSASIAVLVGLTNIVPYVGPIFGGVLGTIIGVLVKYSGAASIGLNVGFWPFVIILIAIFCVTQLIDNYVFKIFIFSTSIQVHPLEIFIVSLMAGYIGGILGMLVAIPVYTVLRVIA